MDTLLTFCWQSWSIPLQWYEVFLVTDIKFISKNTGPLSGLRQSKFYVRICRKSSLPPSNQAFSHVAQSQYCASPGIEMALWNCCGYWAALLCKESSIVQCRSWAIFLAEGMNFFVSEMWGIIGWDWLWGIYGQRICRGQFFCCRSCNHFPFSRRLCGDGWDFALVKVL